MRLIGITGGIATGKSAVSTILQEYYGVPVIYVDKLARLVVEPGSDALRKLVDEFGEEILLESGYMDRRKMRTITVRDPDKMKIVTGIVWPEIAKEITRLMANFKAIGIETVCVENAMLIESGNYELYDVVAVVTCDADVQLARVMERDNQSEEDAMGMINFQMPLADKEKLADVLIVNNGSRATLRKQVDGFYRKHIRKERGDYLEAKK